MDKPRLTYASAVSASIAILYVTVVTIADELSPALKAVLKTATGHHWITKGVSSFALYAILLCAVYGLTKSVDETKLTKALRRLFGAALLGTIALILFFAWHYTKA